MGKTRLVIFGIAAAVSVAILLTITNIGFQADKVTPTSDGELELLGAPYVLGDTIQIAGKINNPSIDIITIEVLDEKKNVMVIEKYGVAENNGQFQKSFSTVKDWENIDWKAGTYTARVAADGIEMSKSFAIDSKPLNES